MMDEKLLTKRDLAAFFQTSAENARKLCAKHGVFPINVGLGQTRTRLRWRMTDVIQVLTTLQAGTNPQKDFRPRRPKDPRILGRTAKEIRNELAIVQ